MLLVTVPARETGLERPVNEFGSVAEDAWHWWVVITSVDEVVGGLIFGAMVAYVDVGAVLAHVELLFWVIGIGNYTTRWAGED